MKQIITLLSLFFALQAYAQDTMYVAQKFGGVIKVPVKNIDSIYFYKPFHNTGTVTDIDGNIYKTVTIANKVWMAENLRVTKFNDGTAIPRVTQSSSWNSLTTPAYTGFRNSTHPDTILPYGNMYNWYTVDTKKVCPTGWHVFTNAEWDAMIATLGPKSTAGNILKATGTKYWQAPNDKATNAVEFNALPSGYMYNYGSFQGLGTFAYWWSATEINTADASSMYVYDASTAVNQYDGTKTNGLSIRCVKD